MTTIRNTTLALTLTAILGSASADGALTRQQVRAELTEARRTGTIVESGESGLKLNEMYPQMYRAEPAARGKTRAQVQAELAEAQRTGNIAASGQSGLLLRELYPHRYPVQAVLPGKTRAEVRAELVEAELLGDVPFGQDGGTLAEHFPARYAAARAKHAAKSKGFADGSAPGMTVAR